MAKAAATIVRTRGGKKKKTTKKTRKKTTPKGRRSDVTEVVGDGGWLLKGTMLRHKRDNVSGCVMSVKQIEGRECYRLRLQPPAVGTASVPVNDLGDWQLQADLDAKAQQQRDQARKGNKAPSRKKTKKKAVSSANGHSTTTKERLEGLVEAHDEALSDLEPAKSRRKKAAAEIAAAEERTYEIVRESKNGRISKPARDELFALEVDRMKQRDKLDRATSECNRLKEVVRENTVRVFQVIRDARDGTDLFA
jgi:hypothetical protein